MNISKFLFPLLLVLVGCGQFAGKQRGKTDESSKDQQLRLDRLVQQALLDSNLPSLSVLISVNGKVSQSTAGVRSSESAANATTQDVYAIGSCTKAMTGLLANIVIQSTDLTWDTTVEEVFGDEMSIDPSLATVTLKELIRHTSGVDDKASSIDDIQKSGINLSGDAREMRRQYSKVVLERKPLFSPNANFKYANGAYVIAASMLEKYTGKSWEEMLTSHVFKPLEMTSCKMGHPNRDTQPIGHTFDKKSNSFKPIPDTVQVLPQYIGPAGDVSCNVGDWHKFTSLFVEESSFLDSESRKWLLDFQSTPAFSTNGEETPNVKYSYGWAHAEIDGDDVFGHSGSDGTFIAQVYSFPEMENTQILLATNAGDLALESGEDDTDQASKAVEKIRVQLFELIKDLR